MCNFSLNVVAVVGTELVTTRLKEELCTMKKFRRGFTLVELLIVIAILGTLTAVMTVSTGTATARAKASSIVSNVEACKTAAAVYYSDNYDATGIATATPANTFLADTNTYVPNFKDFTSSTIKYTAGTTAGKENWTLDVDFTADAEASTLLTALKKAKGYSGLTVGKFTVNLTTGTITAGSGE